jgi:hypothetical protein
MLHGGAIAIRVSLEMTRKGAELYSALDTRGGRGAGKKKGEEASKAPAH